MTSVHVRVQSAPGRPAALERLLRSLDCPAEVVVDNSSPPNPWSGYQKCLSDLPDCTHLAIIQDDTVACRNFHQAAARVAEAHPDAIVCLFLGGLPRRTSRRAQEAAARDRSTCLLHPSDFLPVVATMWPRDAAAQFLQWARENPLKLGHPNPRSDDAVAGRWMRFNRPKVICTVPSLVEHPDDMPSTIGKRASAGANKARVAAMWIGDRDPLEIDWNR